VIEVLTMREGPMAATDPEQVTRLLNEAVRGEAHAARDLLPLVYQQLRKLARHRMTGERVGHTLQATALVHEAYLRLVGDADIPWSGRAHFFSAAAEAMRRILIDQARSHLGPKRSSGGRRVPLNVLDLAAPGQSAEILSLHDAISRLEQVSADLAEVVRLRFYAGLSVEETAQTLRVTPRTVERRWAGARAWLFRELGYAGQ
jgi:RNA polymerase sigma factor (TIGR02999 family)